MSVKTEITIYEINGEEIHGGKHLELESHWNIKTFVILKFGKQKITVSTDELSRAMQATEAAHKR